MPNESKMMFVDGDFQFVPSDHDPLADTQECAPVVLEPETVTVATSAETSRGAWGASTFHNLENGARASGNVRSAHSLLKDADLDWDPQFRPLYTVAVREGGETWELPVSREIGRAVVRSDTKAPIGIVGARYTLIPHRRLADLADALCGTDGTELHFGNAGHKLGGARPFIQLKSDTRRIGRDVRGADVEVQDMVTLMTAHDGSLQALATYGANVIVCNNTYAHALQACKARGVSIRHTATGTDLLTEAIRIAKAASEYTGAFNVAALRLMTKRMGDQEMKALASALVPGDSGRMESARGKLMSAWTSSPGAAPGTAWGAAQAVTYYTTHQITARETTDRAFGLATGEGSGADLQQAAWWHLSTDEGAKALQTVKLYRC